MSNLGNHHSTDTKTRIKAGVIAARAWHRHTAEEDALTYAYRYRLARAEIRALKAASDRLLAIDAKWVQGTVSIPVRTCGSCLPASGDMLWRGGGFALVWFEGSDAPMVWPYADLEVVS